MELRHALWPAIAIAIALLLAPAGIALYRHMIGLHTDARTALAQIEEQMHRRHELLHRLIEHAPEDAKNDLKDATNHPGPSVKEKSDHEKGVRNLLAGMLHRFEHVESTLLDDLERTRLKIDFTATYYNQVVERYNVRLRRGPGRLTRLTGLKPHEPFDLDDT